MANQAPADLVEMIESACQARGLLNSEFFKALKGGKFADEQIKMFISQQFYISRQFPKCLAALYAQLPDVEISQVVVSEFLSIEHWGSSRKGSHSAMFKKTLQFFDLNIDDLKKKKPTPATQSFLEERMKFFLKYSSDSPARVLGAMAFGHEFVNGEIFKAYYEAVSKVEGITPEALEYFEAHTRDEDADYKLLKTIVLEMCVDINVAKIIQDGAMEMLNIRDRFFIGIYNELLRTRA